MLRRLAVGVAGLAVALLAAAACVLSFDDLRALAIAGQAEPRFAYLYPAAFDALLVVALIGVPLVRTGRPLLRLQAGLILVLLMAAAATATVATATGATPDVRQAAVVVALLPWVMLSIGLWLLLILAKQAQAHWSDRDPLTDAAEIVPFEREEPRRASWDAHSPAVSIAQEIAPAPAVFALEEAAPAQEEDAPAPVVSPRPAPEPPRPVRRAPTREPAEAPSRAAVTVTPQEDGPQEAGDAPTTTEPVAAPAEAEPAEVTPIEAEPANPRPEAGPTSPRRNRPVRWGDLVRPHIGDVLVHPRPRGEAPTDSDRESGAGVNADPGEPAAKDARTTPDSLTTPDDRTPDAPGTPRGGAATAEPDEAATPHDTPADIARNRTEQPEQPEHTAHRPSEPHTEPTEKSTEKSGEKSVERRGEAHDARTSEAEIDTQPLRRLPEIPDPAHEADAADEEEARRKPYGTAAEAKDEPVPVDPPSGRMRSTPLPPD
ncbi:DUF2637 domain-containing protein [Microtetraspora sp. AC03309]|uniref:DUF2637 domain-containing protein n=1 Tax=Microtetraspora sp. AC03309 TaxID=2779376 RepID=UPI001E5DD025|nr:DUF2637 domain-containing protein [Microtetraspora sp. AC03309]MCC5579645.1 DUF2637 domain-containing protein [Microtetraspora sp. AC03309]